MLAIQEIDRALKRLYNLNDNYCAEEFLIKYCPVNAQRKAGSKDLKGAVYIQPVEPSANTAEPSVDIGIYLSDDIRMNLESFTGWSTPWSQSQLQAFAVASEEVSHFHYLVHNIERERPVSQFELELQGEVDKFFLLFFSDCVNANDKNEKFDILFKQLFFNFRLISTLTPEQAQRYIDASMYARKFLLGIRKKVSSENSMDRLFEVVRTFYYRDLAGKVGFNG